MASESVETLLGMFLREMDEIGHFSGNTLKAYRIDLHQTFGSQKNQALPTESLLLRIIKEAQIRWGSLELSTRQRKAATVKAFLNWLYVNSYIGTPLNERVEAPKVPRNIPHFLAFDEVLSLFSYVRGLPTEHPNKVRYRALLSLLYGGGLRISEACGVRWDKWRLNTREVCILGKGSKERWVALPEVVIESVRVLPRTGDFIWGEQPLNVRQAFEWIRNMGKEAGLRAPLNPHALRHSYATHLVSAGMNLRTLQELMGHSSLASTEKYMHLSMDQLARTMEARHPLSNKKLKVS